MKITVIGRKKIDYVSKAGKPVKGDKFFFTYKERYTEGLSCDSGFLPEAANIVFPMALPADAELYYNKYGSIDELIFF